MEKLISCAFNMDTACVELRFSDGSICSIDTIAVENEIARNMYERSELDYLIYNGRLKGGKAFMGTPAIPYKDYLRSYAVFKKAGK